MLTSNQETRQTDSALDDWIAEVGEKQVAVEVNDMMKAVEAGLLPGFTDKESFLAYLNSGHRSIA